MDVISVDKLTARIAPGTLVAIPPDSLTNVNTPQDWIQLEGQPG